MRELELDLGFYGDRDGWTCEVIYRGDGSYAADANADTMDGARFAVLAKLTPEQRADLITSMIADLAAVARAEGYRTTRYLDGESVVDGSGEFVTLARGGDYDIRAVLGRTLGIDELRREREAGDG